jgi:GTPase involved in cell partitioning and DNA repair
MLGFGKPNTVTILGKTVKALDHESQAVFAAMKRESFQIASESRAFEELQRLVTDLNKYREAIKAQYLLLSANQADKVSWSDLNDFVSLAESKVGKIKSIIESVNQQEKSELSLFHHLERLTMEVQNQIEQCRRHPNVKTAGGQFSRAYTKQI